MEITVKNFWETLPEVLEAMAAATYVSIDVEMTGINAKRIMSSAKPDINDIYDQAKLAAERFQIVQFGLTCISHSRLTNAYHGRTFNFLITPFFTGTRLVDERLGRVLDRYIGLSHNSVMFLRKHGFDMTRAFKDGIPFLSQAEISELGRKFLQPQPDAIDLTDRLVLSDHGQEAIDFQIEAHRIINNWYTVRPRLWKRNFVNIANPHGGRLNSLQLKIINELVHDQYADCRAFPRNDRSFMQVIISDQSREAQAQRNAELLVERVDATARQTGFTFVMEALMGLDFADTVPLDYLVADKAADRNAAMKRMKERLKDLQTKLTREQPILIGHNVLYDLCFIYRSFFGPLPDTVEEFGIAIRYLFPRIVDTKYLARRPGNPTMLADDTLAELFEAANKMHMPKIFKDADMQEAVQGEHLAPGMGAHQAGYDSWMTAVVFLKNAWTLAEKAETYKWPTPSEKMRDKSYKEDQAVNLKQLREALENMDFEATSDAWEKHRNFEESRRAALQQPGANPELAPLIAGYPAPPVPSYGTMQPDVNWFFTEAPQQYTPKQDPNTSWLLDATPEQSPQPSFREFKDAGVPCCLIPDDAPDTMTPGPSSYQHKEVLGEKLTAGCEMSFATGRIPDWETKFWRVHGNKIRMGLADPLDLDQFEVLNKKLASG